MPSPRGPLRVGGTETAPHSPWCVCVGGGSTLLRAARAGLRPGPQAGASCTPEGTALRARGGLGTMAGATPFPLPLHDGVRTGDFLAAQKV